MPETQAAATRRNQSRRPHPLPRRSVLHANPRRLRRRDSQDRARRKSARRARRRQRSRHLLLPLHQSIEEKHPARDQKTGGPRNPDAPDRRRRRRRRQFPPRRDEGDRARLRNARAAQSAHHHMLDLGLRIDRPAARFSRLRSNRAGDVGSDERDGHRRERTDASRHRDLRSARRNFLGARNSARARSAPSRRPRPAGRDLAARIDRQHPDLVGRNLFRNRQDTRRPPATIIRCRRRTASSRRPIARSTSHAATRRCGKSSSR